MGKELDKAIDSMIAKETERLTSQMGRYRGDLGKDPIIPMKKNTTANGFEGKAVGTKWDEDKLDFSLLDLPFIMDGIRVLMFGAENHGAENWKKLPDLRRRYLNAMFRHITAYAMGEDKDKETGLSHMSHIFCNAMFLHWGERNDSKVQG